MINTIILSGTQPGNNRSERLNKGLININGKLVLEYIISALKSADKIGKIIVVGPKSDLEKPIEGKVDFIVDSNGSILDNLCAGVKYFGKESPILVCTSDIPLITSEAVSDFISRAEETKADFCYPVVDKNVNKLKYPEIDRTYVRTKDGTFTGGNIFYLNPQIIEPTLPYIKKLVESRKSPLKMAGIFGWSFAIRLIAGCISINGLEKKVSRLLNINAKCIVSLFPEIGNDIDKPGDVIVITAHLSK